MINVTIIEDDPKIRKELSKLLEQSGYQTTLISDFENIIEEIKMIETDVILLDVNLPYESGFQICRKLKGHIKTPIIFVTSRDTEEDELLSIQLGGIDFITKPYNKAILLEKIKRAYVNLNPKNFQEITRKGCTLDLHLSILRYNQREIELTRNEFRILYYFFTIENRIVTKEELLEYLWNDKDYLDEGILIVNINRLRKKMREIGIHNLLRTIRKEGYQL